MMEISGLPVLLVKAETLPEAWEKAVLRTWEEGASIRTEYDKPNDPPSRDCTMIIVIRQPFREPRIHRAFPGGLEDLEVYRQEVINGVHDSWIAPEEGKWTYTYHQRLFSYSVEGETINQIEYIIRKLCEKGYTRRAQAITWNPKIDLPANDPPCLQRIWFRISEYNSRLALNMNTHWRSRDAFKAAFMNIFAFTELQKLIAQRLSAKTDRLVEVGRYVDITDSFHIYGSYYEEFKRFMDNIKKRDFKERVWDTTFAEPFFEEARKRLQIESSKKQGVQG